MKYIFSSFFSWTKSRRLKIRSWDLLDDVFVLDRREERHLSQHGRGDPLRRDPITAYAHDLRGRLDALDRNGLVLVRKRLVDDPVGPLPEHRLDPVLFPG